MSTTDDPRDRSILLGGEDAMEVDEAMPLPRGVSVTVESTDLINKIITPSPYAQHNAGPTSSRFRNALNRVTADPTSDVEAWQALLTEVNSSYRSLNSVHAVDAETQAKLDWVESCYGYLLQHFPYAATHAHTIAEMLLTQSARVGEQGGPLTDFGIETTRRAARCEAKVQALLEKLLGVDMEGKALENNKSAGMCSWSVDLWFLYIRKVSRDATRLASTTLPPDERPAKIREATQKAYDTAVQYAASSHQNDKLWKGYVNYIRSWTATPSGNPLQDHALARQQMVQLRQVFQRLVVHPMTGLDQLWQEYEAFERAQNETLAQALIAELAPKYQHARTVYLERNRVYNADALQLGRLATPPVSKSEEDDYTSQMQDEYQLLTLWKTRCSYERTNPERLGATDLTRRVRQIFCEMACVWTRHPEGWHMWSTWELLNSNPEKALQVLEAGQSHIPDCTLLAHAQAQIWEQHTKTPEKSVEVLEKFVEHSPNTLGFVLLQKLVRRYQGIEAARSVFARARRTLVASRLEETENATGETAEAPEAEKEPDAAVQNEEAAEKGWMVTNRLDPNITGQLKAAEIQQTGANGNPAMRTLPGIVTWHLYASHAVMEHRLNRVPQVAARVYELGLRRQASFLTKPPYIMRYAQLLLELGDSVNLRALLTRAVAACEADDNDEALAAIWDMNLHFESLMSGAERECVSNLSAIEAKRRAALMGPDVEDVATGGLVGASDTALIGAQKSSIADQLVRTEGYDMSSSIVNGLSRTVDMFGVMGLWGSDDMSTRKATKQSDRDEDMPGGKSDLSYQNRIGFMTLMAAGMSGDALTDGATGSKILTARERLQQATSSGAAVGGQSSAMMLAIQQSPDWLRPLLLLLPASRLRLPIVAKPPPHLTEMALNALKQNQLPAERPEDTAAGKRSLNDQGDSDDENGGKSGYGSQFRARQRVRQQQNGGGI